MKLRFLLFAAVCILTSIAFGQGDFSFDPTVLSKKHQDSIRKMEALVQEDWEPAMLGSKLQSGHLYEENYSRAEIQTLIYHPMAQIRRLFVDDYLQLGKENRSSDLLGAYLLRYVNDTVLIGYSRGCLVWDIAYADYCYKEVYPLLPKRWQDSVNTQLVENAWPFNALKNLIDKLPESDSSYHILEKLVYEKKQVLALWNLMSYRNPKDNSAPLAFLSANYKTLYPWYQERTRHRDRNPAYYALEYYNYPENASHFQEIIPEVLANKWNDDGYSGYSRALEQYQKDTVLTVLKEIECVIQPNTNYQALHFLYPILDSLPSEDRFRLLPKFFASLNNPKDEDISYVAKKHTELFEQAVSFRLTTQHDACYDTSTLSQIFKHYLQGKDKTPFLLEACKIGQGPALDYYIDYLKPRHPEELYEILYQRFKAILIDSTPSPYYYENYSAAGAVVHADAVPLYQRLTKLILSTNNEEFIADNYGILTGSQLPDVIEMLFKKVESKNYTDDTHSSLVFHLLMMGDLKVNERLIKYYKLLKSKKYNPEELARFREQLSRYVPIEDL